MSSFPPPSTASPAPPKLNYLQIYKQFGNALNSDKGMNIPIFTCGHSFGDVYARSVSFGLSKLFSLENIPTATVIDHVYAYMLEICKENVRSEHVHHTYTHLVHKLAQRCASVFAISYKHKLFDGGECGNRQRICKHAMRAMAGEIVAHAQRSGKVFFCFWLDQILGQRKPRAQRNWVDNGLLPYAVFDTIVFPYTGDEMGAWLTVEKVLASGRYGTQSGNGGSILITTSRDEGGPDSLMTAAAALASGAIDQLRGDYGDKCSIVNWALEILDMSAFMKGNQVGHFTRVFHSPQAWDRRRLSSVMANLDIVPGAMEKDGAEGNGPRTWVQEASLLSMFIPDDVKRWCDGSWLSRGRTRVFATESGSRLVYLQTVRRGCRPRLVIAGIVERGGRTGPCKVGRYWVGSFDEIGDQSARRVLDEGGEMVKWAPVDKWLRKEGMVVREQVGQFDGKWNCS